MYTHCWVGACVPAAAGRPSSGSSVRVTTSATASISALFPSTWRKTAQKCATTAAGPASLPAAWSLLASSIHRARCARRCWVLELARTTRSAQQRVHVNAREDAGERTRCPAHRVAAGRLRARSHRGPAGAGQAVARQHVQSWHLLLRGQGGCPARRCRQTVSLRAAAQHMLHEQAVLGCRPQAHSARAPSWLKTQRQLLA